MNGDVALLCVEVRFEVLGDHGTRQSRRMSRTYRAVAATIIQHQLAHTALKTSSTYLQGIDPTEIIDAVRFRRQPTTSATAGLTL